MTGLRPLLGLAMLATACVAQDPAQTTFPQQWGEQPQQISGPPGGEIDPGYGYQQPGYPQGYQGGYAAPSPEEQATDSVEPSADPQAPGYDMGAVTDPEIDSTLDGYGSWEENEDYGRVWRPSTTVVGVDFTPYDTCGSWLWSDAGWNYSCDWSWGWLPFHYGRWAWLDNSWAWVPGYEWGPGWVDWRNGGGYVGWRPTLPNVRDHRGEHNPPTFHDHRLATSHDAHWRFASESDFGHTHIHGHLFQNPSEGLRVTQPVTRPNIRGNYAPVSSASVMRARLDHLASRPQTGWRQPSRPQSSQPAFRNPPAQQSWNRANEQPTWQRPQRTWHAPQQTYAPQQTWHAPQQTWHAPAQSQPTWHAPTQSQPTWHAPAQTFHPSSSSSSWSAPSHSSSSGGGGYHSSGGGGSSHSSGGHSSGGHSSGGHR